jgi:uncharacterized protein YciI
VVSEDLVGNVRYVIFHRPGPAWQPGVGFQSQPGIMDHVLHYSRLRDEGKLAMGGPFLGDRAGAMMVSALGVERDELEAYAAADPAVRDGVLTYEVQAWLIALHGGPVEKG